MGVMGLVDEGIDTRVGATDGGWNLKRLRDNGWISLGMGYGHSGGRGVEDERDRRGCARSGNRGIVGSKFFSCSLVDARISDPC